MVPHLAEEVHARLHPGSALVAELPWPEAEPALLVAETVTVPPTVLPLGLLARATAVLPVKPVATLPWASSAVTVNPKPVPAVTVAGGWFVTSS